MTMKQAPRPLASGRLRYAHRGTSEIVAADPDGTSEVTGTACLTPSEPTGG